MPTTRTREPVTYDPKEELAALLALEESICNVHTLTTVIDEYLDGAVQGGKRDRDVLYYAVARLKEEADELRRGFYRGQDEDPAPAKEGER